MDLSSTNPPYKERAADPDTAPAKQARALLLFFNSKAALTATTSAENAEEEDAKPAEIGKLHSLSMYAKSLLFPAKKSIQLDTLGNISVSERPFTDNLSC